MINQLHISSVNHEWTDAKLVLLNQRNVDKIINTKDQVDCHTSPEDLSYDCVHQALSSAVEIHLVDIDFHNTNADNFDTYGRLLNELVRQRDKIVGPFDIPGYRVASTARPSGSVVWTAGCSITAGSAIPVEQRFGRLVADALGRQEVCLALPSAGIFWAADRILRADLKPGDIVIWGLTNVPRVEIATDWQLSPVNVNGLHRLNHDTNHWNLCWFSSPTQTLMSLHYVDQVQNFCKKLDVELYIFNVLDVSWMSTMLTKYSNYLDLVKNLKVTQNGASFIDHGHDNLHPGTAQHQQWADEILDFINHSKMLTLDQQ